MKKVSLKSLLKQAAAEADYDVKEKEPDAPVKVHAEVKKDGDRKRLVISHDYDLGNAEANKIAKDHYFGVSNALPADERERVDKELVEKKVAALKKIAKKDKKVDPKKVAVERIKSLKGKK